ncbi:MAG: YbjQ family protein [Candidatus Nitronauta litoralis]|uniref:YbjQ family protein n=1 Tax=Candidatus Nitronauta litoralis TaxID=2705533 RepID=A0A7T0BWP6_9BACT|nr:MAG: YbjQ family protein [Candidatus Nitronauta litoralis]
MDNLIAIIVLTLIGFITGKVAEKRHYTSIKEREKATMKLPTTNTRKPLGVEPGNVRMELVSGSVVISVDYFKMMLAGLQNIFGGHVTAYEPLIDRARREAILRMKEQKPNAIQIFNVRIETTSISKNAGRGAVGSVEVLAYGTALTKAH